ncbi:MAG: hypothetical protein R3345_15800, partial [Fulvivirga sp.]|nr:hypothetical protein [Fulvivirga sp.]
FRYQYEDFELLSDGSIWLKSAAGEGIFNKQLEPLISESKYGIEILPKGYLVKKSTHTTLLDKNFKTIEAAIEWLGENDRWLLGKKESSFIAYRQDNLYQQIAVSDSTVLFGEHYLLSYYADSTVLYFSERSFVVLPGETKFQLLKTAESPEYIMAYQKGSNVIYDPEGNSVLQTDIGDIKPLGKAYFVVTVRGKKGLIDASTGKELLSPRYEAIGNYNNGFVSLLNNERFGLYNAHTQIHIEPAYEKNLRIYNDSVFISEKNGLQWLIDKNNEALHKEGFEEVKYWNDTTAFVRQTDGWRKFSMITQAYSAAIFNVLREITFEQERFILVLSENKYGVFSAVRGEIIPPVYNDIVVLKSSDQILFFTEKHIQEADFFVVIYYDGAGNIIRKQAYEPEDYYRLYCDR